MDKYYSKQFIIFLIVGGVNTIFSYSIYNILVFIDIEYQFASFLALISGIFFSFKTQGKFVFDNNNSRLLPRFIICWIIIYFFNIILIGKLIELGFNAYQAGAITLIPVALFSYFIQKLIVFRKNAT